MVKDDLFGAAIERREDRELITGERPYTDDLPVPNAGHVAFLRSDYGHASIEQVDTTPAEKRDDVIAVFTAEDVARAEVSDTISVSASPPGGKTTERPLLAGDTARFTGEPIAMVVAEDRYAAHQARDLIEVEYERRDAVTDAREAVAGDAPTVHEEWSDNVALDWEFGDRDATAEILEEADHTASLSFRNQRLIPNPIEPRTMIADHDPASDELVVTISTQRPHTDRAFIADTLQFPEHKIRVETPAVGGAFGSKGRQYPETVLTAWGATRLEQPVRWAATRTESFRSDLHSRNLYVSAEIGIDADGTIRGLDIESRLGIGAYVGWGPTTAKNVRHLLSGQYDIPAISGRIVGAFTHTAPIGPYRGAGRPESIFTIERMVRRAAEEIGMDPAELRRHNQIPPDAFPYRTAVNAEYDSGDYTAALDRALEIADYDSLRQRRRELREEGRYLGIGLSCFVESTGSSPRSNPGAARVAFDRSGSVTAYCGTADHGQGHETTFAQLLAAELGIPYEDVEIREGNTDDLLQGKGTFGSRSAPVGGSALLEGARDVIEKGREIAAHHFDVTEEEVAFEDGVFDVPGSLNPSITIQEIAALARSDADLPPDVPTSLEATAFYDPEAYAYSFGTHLAAVEVDPESGEIEFDRYVAVDDCGNQINPRIVEGQIHGGVAQGIGQALYEWGRYDATGSLVSGSFQDYAMPRAEHVPEMEVDETVTPCPHNPLGVKGVGESGAIGAPPAVVNAVVDALQPFDVDTVEMPITAERIWQAVHQSDSSD